MYKDSLYDLIRQEEVVLWVGAGLSHYAGYPSGSELAKKIYNNLNQSEKSVIDPNGTLSRIAEEYIRVKGNKKTPLIKLLRTIFQKNPHTIKIHEQIRSIPHFKTIITTNYDNLFEVVYKDTIQKISISKDIPLINKSKIELFKIHGDIDNSDSEIIIAERDYQQLFKKLDNTYWAVINERIATNNVLFVGYGFEDQDTNILFDKIHDEFAGNTNQLYLVAPNLPQHKVNYLIQKGILYIDSTAEVLFKELTENIKDNIAFDFREKKVSTETFHKFMNIHAKDVQFDLTYQNDSQKIKSIYKDGGIRGLLTFNINDVSIREQIDNFFLGKTDKLELPHSKLNDFKLSFEGITLEKGNSNTVKFLLQKPVITADIILPNRTIYGIPTSIINSEDIDINLKFESGTISIHGEGDIAEEFINLGLSYEHKGFIQTTKDEIDFYEFLYTISNESKFTIMLNHDGKSFELNYGTKYQPELEKAIKPFFDFFIGLKTIEDHYNIKFSNIDIINDENQKIIQTILNCINSKPQKIDWNKPFKISLHKKEDAEYHDDGNPFVFYDTEPTTLDLFGHTFNIGYRRIEFCDAIVSSSLELKDEYIIYLNGKNNTILVSYIIDISDLGDLATVKSGGFVT